MYKIYVLKDDKNHIKYVGITKNSLKTRLNGHISKSKRNVEFTHKTNWIKSLLNENVKPTIEEIESVDTEIEALNREIFWIKHFKELGCNLTNTTEGGDASNMNEYIKQKLSSTQKNNYKNGLINPMKGKKRPDLLLRNLTNHPTKDKNVRDKISKTLKEKFSTKEIKDRFRLLQKKRKEVIQKTLNGDFVRKWDSLSQIESELKFDRSTITRICNGKGKTAYGYKWEYVEK